LLKEKARGIRGKSQGGNIVRNEVNQSRWNEGVEGEIGWRSARLVGENRWKRRRGTIAVEGKARTGYG